MKTTDQLYEELRAVIDNGDVSSEDYYVLLLIEDHHDDRRVE